MILSMCLLMFTVMPLILLGNLQLSHQTSINLGGPTSEFFWLPHGHMVSPKAFKS